MFTCFYTEQLRSLIPTPTLWYRSRISAAFDGKQQKKNENNSRSSASSAQAACDEWLPMSFIDEGSAKSAEK